MNVAGKLAYAITFPIVLFAILWNVIVRRILWGAVRVIFIAPVQSLKESNYKQLLLSIILAFVTVLTVVKQDYIKLPYQYFLTNFDQANDKGYDTFMYHYQKSSSNYKKWRAYHSYNDTLKSNAMWSAKDGYNAIRPITGGFAFNIEEGAKSSKYSDLRGKGLDSSFEFWKVDANTQFPSKPLASDTPADKLDYYRSRGVPISIESFNDGVERVYVRTERTIDEKNKSPLSAVFPSEPIFNDIMKPSSLFTTFTAVVLLMYLLLTLLKSYVWEKLMIKLFTGK